MTDFTIDNVLELLEKDDSILTPDLLKPVWRKKNISSGIHSTGHCYAASEALYYLFGGKDTFTPHMNKDESGNSHWWLVRKSDSKIIDPTSSQFTKLNIKPPYIGSKGRGFMQQSDRSKIIMERIKKHFF